MTVERANTEDQGGPVDPGAAIDALANETDGASVDGGYDVLVVRDQRYRLVKEIPARTMMKLAASSDPKTSPPKQMSAIGDFLERIIIEDDREEFLDYLEDAEPVIGFDEINQILTDAVEAISDRPTQP